MPELPDITVYVEALEARVKGHALEKVRLASPFLLRTATPPIKEVEGKKVLGLRRMGKRIVFLLEDDLFMIVHLMIAGRFKWKERGASIPGKVGLAAFDFPTGTLILTEASPKKRASLHLVRGEEELAKHDPGGIEIFESSLEDFARVLREENHTIKRSLTDPRMFSGIGNAYSDEILHRAKMSPAKLTQKLGDEEIAALFEATRATLREWTERLRAEAKESFPEHVTAFREEMAVHGKHKQPCPVCGAPVQRIAYADNETNYCARCQTEGKLLADRSLSRLLKDDWPKTLDALESLLPSRGQTPATRPRATDKGTPKKRAALGPKRQPG